AAHESQHPQGQRTQGQPSHAYTGPTKQRLDSDTSSMPFGTPASRRLLLTMVLCAVLIDAAAIGSFYAFDVERRPQQIRFVFTPVWVLATLAVCAVYLKRIR